MLQIAEHIVRSFQYDIRMDNEAEAFAFQSKISMLHQHQVGNLTEKIFDQYSPVDNILHFDLVELDLGIIPKANFDKDFVNRLEERLHLFFSGMNFEIDHKQNGYKVSIQQSKVKLFEHFLIHGYLSWAHPTHYKPQTLLNELISEKSNGLAQILLKHGKKETVRKRMIFQFTDPELESIVTFIAGNEGKTIIKDRQSILLQQSHQVVDNISPSNFNDVLWEIVLAYLFLETGSYYSRKYRLSYLLHRVAQKYHINYSDLLNSMETGIKTDKENRGRDYEFKKIIIELKKEESTLPSSTKEPKEHYFGDRNINLDKIFYKLIAYYNQNHSFPQVTFLKTKDDLDKLVNDYLVRYPLKAKRYFNQLLKKYTPALLHIIPHLKENTVSKILGLISDEKINKLVLLAKLIKSNPSGINSEAETIFNNQFSRIVLTAFDINSRHKEPLILSIFSAFKLVHPKSAVQTEYIENTLKFLPKETRNEIKQFLKAENTDKLIFESGDSAVSETAMSLIDQLEARYFNYLGSEFEKWISYEAEKALGVSGMTLKEVYKWLAGILPPGSFINTPVITLEKSRHDANISIWQDIKRIYEEYKPDEARKPSAQLELSQNTESVKKDLIAKIRKLSEARNIPVELLIVYLVKYQNQYKHTADLKNSANEIRILCERTGIPIKSIIDYLENQQDANTETTDLKEVTDEIRKLFKTSDVPIDLLQGYLLKYQDQYTHEVNLKNILWKLRSETNQIKKMAWQLESLLDQKPGPIFRQINLIKRIETEALQSNFKPDWLISELCKLSVREPGLLNLRKILEKPIIYPVISLQKQDKTRSKQFSLDIVRYYLANNSMPWWSKTKVEQLSGHIDYLLKASPKEMMNLLKDPATDKQTVALLSKNSYQEVLHSVNHSGGAAFYQVQYILEDFLQDVLLPIRPSAVKEIEWLRYTFLVSRPDTGSVAETLNKYFQHLSVKIGIAQSDLARMLHHHLSNALKKAHLKPLSNWLKKHSTLTSKVTRKVEIKPEKLNFHKLLFGIPIPQDQKPNINSDNLFMYLNSIKETDQDFIKDQLKNSHVRKRIIDRVSRKNMITLVEVHLNAQGKGTFNAALSILNRISKSITLTQYDAIWRDFFNSLLLKLSTDKASSWRLGDWSWMIYKSMENVFYKDKVTELIHDKLIQGQGIKGTEEKLANQLKITTQKQKQPERNDKREIKTPVAKKIEKEQIDEEILFVDNAGLIILWPFLSTLFKLTGLKDDKNFKDEICQNRAIQLLQYAATGHCSHDETNLTINKVLCGLDLNAPLIKTAELTAAEKELVDSLLKEVIKQWSILKDTSISGLREIFLQRKGSLMQKTDENMLTVEPKSFDVLLDNIPWSITSIKLSWMEKLLLVKWR